MYDIGRPAKFLDCLQHSTNIEYHTFVVVFEAISVVVEPHSSTLEKYIVVDKIDLQPRRLYRGDFYYQLIVVVV